MIKRYLEKREKFNTIGEWVESLIMMTIRIIVNIG
jgi:hypothetical protein